MKMHFSELREIRSYLLLWATQFLSGLGSGMTSYALVIWSYSQEGSALATSLTMVCSYTPYVLCSVFAGALSDRWDKKRTLLVCDALAAFSTLVMLFLLRTDSLRIWHLYVINFFSGLMNTVQQPASEVATTQLLPRRLYQKVGGLRQLASSVSSILTPVLATTLLSFGGMNLIIAIDLGSCMLAVIVLLFFIRIPQPALSTDSPERLPDSVRIGLHWLRDHPGILHLMFFLAAINLVASMYNAALPAMMLSRTGGGEQALGIISTTTSVAMLIGSALSLTLPTPKSRVKAIWYSLLLSMCTENFILAFGRSVPVWCVGAFLGWITIPWMNVNLGTINRLTIPAEIQGRVFAVRNSFQFFTIPLGYFLGGLMVDQIFEPLMAHQPSGSLLVSLFGPGKGSGAAFFFAVIGVLGVLTCLLFHGDRHIHALESSDASSSDHS